MISRNNHRRAWMAGTALAAVISTTAMAQTAPAAPVDFQIAAGDLGDALGAYAKQAGVEIFYQSRTVAGRRTPGLTGAYAPRQGLDQLLAGTGLIIAMDPGGAMIVQEPAAPQGGSAAGNAVQALIVTAQKREEDIQDVPIAISAFSQDDLTERQVAGGPDLMTQIPNMSFTKTNFSSYSIQIRGIGTQAISATTDPAVAVAFNNTPFIRNRFFEQEFYDLERLEVLRGPQGTLYGRNATAGVVNLISAKPKFRYEAKASADVGNYNSTRIEGMINIPLVEDVVALRLAGAWTKRDGYATNQMTGSPIDGRDLWSTRLSLRFEPTDWISANFIYEHFEESDDRLRSGKQLCKKDLFPSHVNGVPLGSVGGSAQSQGAYLSQGCERVSLYSPEAFQTPNGFALPFYGPTQAIGNPVIQEIDPYLNATQSRDLRVIESSVEPDYRAKVDIAQLQLAIDLSDSLTLSSETAYGADFLWSLQDYNRFTTTPGAFRPSSSLSVRVNGLVDDDGFFCDPQLGCSDRVLLVDLSTEKSTQFSQEFRLGSDFDGPFNFSLGVNYLRHDAEAKYYVFINTLTMLMANGRRGGAANAPTYVPGVSDNSECQGFFPIVGYIGDAAPYYDPTERYFITFNNCGYIDPNPIGSLNDQGRNYFLSRNPYKLISYAAFGEIYYNVTPDLKVTGGLRWTVDRKTAPQIPSWLLAHRTAGEYPTAKTLFMEWREPTGRLAIDWKPELPFTDETLVYASYAHGYKAGGTNPPPPVLVDWAETASGNYTTEFIPDTFGPEFVDAFEIGTKNTLFDGALTLNMNGFYYDYKGYQVSEIRNRSAVNSNYDAEVWGVEIEADWRPTETLRLGFKGGYNGTRIADGETAIDLMDRTAGTPGWIVLRPFPTIPSNCIIPEYVAGAGGRIGVGSSEPSASACVKAYVDNVDPVTELPYDPSITDYANAPYAGIGGGVLGPAFADYIGFDPSNPEINGGRGFSKQLGGNELPNAPNYTATLTVDYRLPLAGDWLVNLHSDLHWQSESWWRVFDDHEYNRLDAFYTMNLAATFINEDAGWKVMTYIKNVTDETALTGAFLNSDDTGLTTNVFLTEPRLYGVRVTKDFTGGGWLGDIGRCETVCPLTVEIGGGVGRATTEDEHYLPTWLGEYSAAFPLDQSYQDEDTDWGDQRSIKAAWAAGDWRVSGAYRFGKMKRFAKGAAYEHVDGATQEYLNGITLDVRYVESQDNHLRGAARNAEEYEIADFAVGREIGFGAFGDGGRSTLSVGLRRAELTSTSKVSMNGIPDRFTMDLTFFGGIFGTEFWSFSSYVSSLESQRSFEGLGPMATWDASLRLWGDEERGHADLDWSVGGGVLFGKQEMDSSEDRLGTYHKSGIFDFRGGQTGLYDEQDIPRHREDDVTVPNVSLSLGVSYAIDRVKVSTGYSYDRFFDAIDGGFDEAKQYDRTIQGPYFRLSVGFGG